MTTKRHIIIDTPSSLTCLFRQLIDVYTLLFMKRKSKHDCLRLQITIEKCFNWNTFRSFWLRTSLLSRESVWNFKRPRLPQRETVCASSRDVIGSMMLMNSWLSWGGHTIIFEQIYGTHASMLFTILRWPRTIHHTKMYKWIAVIMFNELSIMNYNYSNLEVIGTMNDD